MDLERQILEAAADRGSGGVYGFSLARDLAGESGATKLVGHGTMYKALDRLRREGLLESEWEDPGLAEADGRPRRRFYRITVAGSQALATADSRDGSRLRLGEAGV